jgi:outer membrane protein TolC
MELAVAANPDLVSASEQLSIADATLARARAEFYPKLGISEQYGVTNNPVAAFSFQLNQAQLSPMQDFNNPGVIDDFHTQLRLQHRVYAGEQRLHEKHAAEAGVSAAAFNLEAVHNQLVFRIAEAYYRLLQARDLIQVRREAVDQVEQHLKIVQSRFRNETAVKSDVLTVEVRLAEVREALISASNQLELSWAVLSNVVGARIDQHQLPAEIPAAPWDDRVDELEAAVANALGTRPELGAIANRRDAAGEQVLVADAGKRLNVDAVLDYDVYTSDFRRGNDSFFAGLVFQLNLFDGGRTSAEVDRAMARARELEARERRLVLDIELDVRRAFLQLSDAGERLKVATQAIGQAQESLREIEARYRGQTATITQLIDAQVTLSNTRVRRTNNQADVEIARASLERAIGRLTQFIAP